MSIWRHMVFISGKKAMFTMQFEWFSLCPNGVAVSYLKMCNRRNFNVARILSAKMSLVYIFINGDIRAQSASNKLIETFSRYPKRFTDFGTNIILVQCLPTFQSMAINQWFAKFQAASHFTFLNAFRFIGCNGHFYIEQFAFRTKFR